jgi:hypothetical protein
MISKMSSNCFGFSSTLGSRSCAGMNVDEQGGFDGQGNERDRRAARTELRLGNADGEHEPWRGSTDGGDGSNGEEREREMVASSGREEKRGARRPIYRGWEGRGEVRSASCH